MAKKHLEQYDENGQRVDIYLNDDEVMVDDKTLAAKLEEMQEDIDDAASQGGIQQETDPTVPAWAKQPTKPTYTAQEVGALPADTPIPSKTSDLDNDSGFITLNDVPQGAVVEPGTATPSMDGNAAVGTSAKYAREDHVHPHDTSKQDALVAGNGIVIANDGKTVSVDAEVVQPVTADGTFSIRIGNNTYTINLNHSHPQYLQAQSLKAGSNVSLSVNQQTGEVTISATGGGGGGGISGITMNGNAVTVNNGVANLGTVLTQHQSLAGRVQSQDVATIVKITQAAYDALSTKDSSTLYLITES